MPPMDAASLKQAVAFRRETLMELRPKLKTVPHLFFEAGNAALRAVLSVTGDGAGLYGDRPWYAEDGSRYHGMRDSAEEFVLWRSRANQAWLREKGGIPKLGHGVVYLRASLSATFIRDLREAIPRNEAPELDNMWKTVAEALPRLQWAWFLFDDEEWLTLFVAHHEWLRDKLRAKLHRPAAEFAWPDGLKR